MILSIINKLIIKYYQLSFPLVNIIKILGL